MKNYDRDLANEPEVKRTMRKVKVFVTYEFYVRASTSESAHDIAKNRVLSFGTEIDDIINMAVTSREWNEES